MGRRVSVPLAAGTARVGARHRSASVLRWNDPAARPRFQPPHSPGPQTVDLTPVFSSTGTRLMAPSMCWVNTSQSRSKRPKANLSDT